MKRPAPFVTLWLRMRQERNDLRGQLADALEELDQAKADLAVVRCRCTRWRRAAFELAPAVSPRAMEVLLMQAESDELADAPEIADTARNAFPRSLPS